MAAVFGPGQKLSQFNDEFMKELEDDFQSPGSSKFQNYMNRCREGMQKMEEVSVSVFAWNEGLLGRKSCKASVNDVPFSLLTNTGKSNINLCCVCMSIHLSNCFML